MSDFPYNFFYEEIKYNVYLYLFLFKEHRDCKYVICILVAYKLGILKEQNWFIFFTACLEKSQFGQFFTRHMFCF